jgi:hypothetical protein
VVPGLAGTVAAYAVAQLGWPTWLGPVDRLVRTAAAHTLGIFLAHYALYYVVDRTGIAGTVPGAVALPLGMFTALVLAAVAPRAPQPPWSLRTGSRRRSPPQPAADSAVVSLPTP